MSGGSHADGEDGGPGLDRLRMRAALRILAVGWGLAVLLSLGSGLAGGEGEVGAAVLLLVGALATGIAGLHAVVTLVVDDLRDRHPAGRRAGLAAGLFVLAAALMAAVAAIGG